MRSICLVTHCTSDLVIERLMHSTKAKGTRRRPMLVASHVPARLARVRGQRVETRQDRHRKPRVPCGMVEGRHRRRCRISRNRSRDRPKKKFNIPLDRNSIHFSHFSCKMHSTHQHTSGHCYAYRTFFWPRGSKIGFALLNASCVHNCFRKKVAAVAVGGYKSTKCHLVGRSPTSL